MSSASTDPRHVGRTDAEKEAFREEMDRLAGLSDCQTMLCVAGVVEPEDEESLGRFGWGTMNREGRELVKTLYKRRHATISWRKSVLFQ